jgi:hypothetical protein
MPDDPIEFETDHPSQLSDQYRVLRLPRGETPGNAHIYRQPGGCLEIHQADEDGGEDILHFCSEQDAMNMVGGVLAVLLRVPVRF